MLTLQNASKHGYVLHDNIHEIKTWKCPIQAQHWLGYQGFLQARFGGETPPKKSVTPPQNFTDFIFIHLEPPTPRLLPPPPKSFNSPPKGEILQETLVIYSRFMVNIYSIVLTWRNNLFTGSQLCCHACLRFLLSNFKVHCCQMSI